MCPRNAHSERIRTTLTRCTATTSAVVLHVRSRVPCPKHETPDAILRGMSNVHQDTDVAIIGAGPIGIELAVALKQAGVDYGQIEAGAIGATIVWYPPEMQFHSSADRLALALVLGTQALI